MWSFLILQHILKSHLRVLKHDIESLLRLYNVQTCGGVWLTTMFLFFVQGLRGPVGSPGTPGQAGMSVCTQTFLICAGFSFNRNCKWWDGLKAPEHPPSPLSHQICELCYKLSDQTFLPRQGRVCFSTTWFACARVRVLVSVRVRDCACACECNCEWTEERV